MEKVHTFHVIPGGGGESDGPPVVVTHVQLLVFSLRHAAKYLRLAADNLEAEIAVKGFDASEEAQAAAVARALIGAVGSILN